MQLRKRHCKQWKARYKVRSSKFENFLPRPSPRKASRKGQEERGWGEEVGDAMTQSAQPSWRSFFQGRDAAKKQFIAGTISPLVLYMAFWTIFPLLWGVLLAFFDYSPRNAGGFLGFGGDNPFVGLQHFQNMMNFSSDAPLEVQQFHIGIKITILFAALVVPLNLLVTLPLAFMIESVHERVKGIFRTLFFLPVLAPLWGCHYVGLYLPSTERLIERHHREVCRETGRDQLDW